MALTNEELNRLRVNLVNQQKQTNAPLSVSTPQDGYASRVGQSFAKVGADVVEGVKQGATSLEQGLAGKKNPLEIAGGVLRTGLRTAGGVAEAAIAPIIEAPGIKQGLGAVGGTIAKIPGVSQAVDSLSQLATKHPESAKDIKNIVDILALGGGSVLEQPIKQGVLKAGEIAAKGAAPALERTGQILKTAGEKSTGVGVAMSEPTRIAVQAYQAQQPSLLGRIKNFFTAEAEGTKPITEANTAVRQGLVGTEWQVGVQAKKTSDSLWKGLIEPSLDASQRTVSKGDFLNGLKSRIISENADLVRRKSLLNALESFADDYKNVNNFGLKKLQEYKEGWAKFVPEKAYKGNPIAGSLNEVRNLAAQEARKIIYADLGDAVKTAYIDYGNLKSIAESGIKSVDQLRPKGITKQAWEFILDKAITPVTTSLGQVLYRTGEGLELVGKEGAKKIRDIIK